MKTKKAVAVTTARYDKRQLQTYPKPAQLSSLKTLIGELLLFGNQQRKEFWWLFDSKLRQFYDLKMYEGKQ